MFKTDLPLSLKSNTFNGLCEDFDAILRRTISGMVDTDQSNAEVNIKVKISLKDSSAPDYTVSGGHQTREITKPKFEHTVSAIIQRKEKKSGVIDGELELVFDISSGRYVMRPIDNGQVDIFEEKVIDVEYEDSRCLPESAESPCERVESDGSNYTDDGCCSEHEPVSEFDATPFGWMKQFVGQDLDIVENEGTYTVRNENNKIVISSATSDTSPFYCSAEVLAPCVDHELLCVGKYAEESTELVEISIVCCDCDRELFSIRERCNIEDDYGYESTEEQ